jgi:hypothetical protein
MIGGVASHAHSSALARSRARLRDLFADRRPIELKQPGANAQTCTAARWWLDSVSPQQASSLVDDLRVCRNSPPGGHGGDINVSREGVCRGSLGFGGARRGHVP